MEKTQMLGLPIYAPEDIFDLTEVNKAHKNIEIAYQAMEGIQSVNANAEVIGARKGEPNLKTKIDKIDDAVDANANEITLVKDFANVLEEDIENINLSLENILTYNKVYQKEKEFLSKYGLDETVLDLRYPYCHVHRYGAINDGSVCCSDAIQVAVDLAEWLGNNTYVKGGYPIKFEGGSYKITKPILIKYDKTLCVDNTPICFNGADISLTGGLGSAISYHTNLILEIPNHKNKDYANAFVINNKYSDDKTEDLDVVAFSKTSITDGGFILYNVVSNISFNNISFIVSNGFNVNIVKGYRYRSLMENICVKNANKLVWQPTNDKNGVGNYCDFSVFKNIHFEKIKSVGLELCSSDNSLLEDFTCHRLGKNATSLIKVVSGGSFKISRIHYAYSFVDGTTKPRQDGVGIDGTKSIIILNNCKSVKIENMYIERSLKDYVVRLYNTKNIEICNTSEMFFGNGFICVDGTKCDGINIHDIYRNSNLVTEYNDIYIKANTKVSNLKINNFFARDFYSDVISLATTDYSTLTALDGTSDNYREVKANIDFSKDYLFDIEEMTLNISYYDGNWVVKKGDGTYLTTYNLEFDNGVLTLPNFISSVEPSFSDNSSLIPYIPCVNSNNRKQVYFFDASSNSVITSVDNRIRFNCKIKTLNKYIYF